MNKAVIYPHFCSFGPYSFVNTVSKIHTAQVPYLPCDPGWIPIFFSSDIYLQHDPSWKPILLFKIYHTITAETPLFYLICTTWSKFLLVIYHMILDENPFLYSTYTSWSLLKPTFFICYIPHGQSWLPYMYLF